MATRIAINGFGRIGRLTLRTMHERHRNEAADSDFTSADTDHDNHIMQALARVQNGWRP